VFHLLAEGRDPSMTTAILDYMQQKDSPEAIFHYLRMTDTVLLILASL
jgi:hypothetical protein